MRDMNRTAKRDPALVALAHWQRIEDKINRSKYDTVAVPMLKQSRVVEGRLEKTVPTTMDGVIGMLNWVESQARIGLIGGCSTPMETLLEVKARAEALA